MALNAKQKLAVKLITEEHDGNVNYSDIADQVGITSRTLRKWRKEPEFIEALDHMADERIDSTLYSKAVSGDVRAIKEWNSLRNRGKDTHIDPLAAVRDATPEELSDIEMSIVQTVLNENPEVIINELKSRGYMVTTPVGSG